MEKQCFKVWWGRFYLDVPSKSDKFLAKGKICCLVNSQKHKSLTRLMPEHKKSVLISIRIPFLSLHWFLVSCETSAHVILPQNIDRWTVCVNWSFSQKSLGMCLFWCRWNWSGFFFWCCPWCKQKESDGKVCVCVHVLLRVCDQLNLNVKWGCRVALFRRFLKKGFELHFGQITHFNFTSEKTTEHVLVFCS